MSTGNLFSKNRIALIDGNSFYASCEILTRPELRGRPVGVLSNNDGCFVSATKELKAVGIKTGTPRFQVEKILKNMLASVHSANFANYAFLSKGMFKTVRNHTPFLKVYSIDEGLIDVNHVGEYNLFDYGFYLRDNIEDESGIPVGVGIGPNFSLCKIANKWSKSNPCFKNVYVINQYNLDYTLENTPVKNLWGIGRSSAHKLSCLGIHNAKQFRDYPYVDKIQELLTINGRKLQLELKGVYCFRIDEPLPKKNEISHSRTLPKATNDKEILRQVIATFATLASDELRKEGFLCKEVSLYLRTNPFKKDQPGYENSVSLRLMAYTFDTFKIIEAAWIILEKMHCCMYQYNKIGVSLKNFQDYTEYQPSLISLDDSPQTVSLIKANDKITSRFGEEAIRSGACGIQNGNFEADRKMQSPSYFTNWNDIPKINKVLT